MSPEQCEQLKAVESLRGGVPSRSVVRFIPPSQSDIDRAFGVLMESVTRCAGEPELGRKPARPMLLAGEFGAGKTHWIDTLLTKALDSGFVCSWIAVNKETPLYDLEKLYRAIISNSFDSQRAASAIREIVTDYDSDKAPGHRDFYLWSAQAQANGKIDPRLGASLELFSNSNDEEIRGQILSEWMGFPMKVTDFHGLLEKSGQPIPRPFPKVVKDNYVSRFEFLGRLIASAGYSGWIVFLDEVEMISKYSLRQRAKSYANLARLMGGAAQPPPACVGVVAAITPDFSSSVLRDIRKNDIESIPAKLAATKDHPFIDDARVGMNLIDTQALLIDRPTQASMRAVYTKVSDLYSSAYGGWQTPDVFDRAEYGTTVKMRKHIRVWINLWDMNRIYGYAANPEIVEVKQNFDEEAEYQHSSDDADGPETIL